MPRPDTLFLDLDGVLVNFVGAALKLHNATLPMRDVRWDFCTQIGFVQGVNDPLFWADMNFNFWANLELTSEALELLDGLERIFDDRIALMTSPCLTMGSVEGKVAWIAKNLPRYRRRYFVGPVKHLAAGPGKLLLDDHDLNCAKFAVAGGVAITVPRPWNDRRDETDQEGRFDVSKLLSEVQSACA